MFHRSKSQSRSASVTRNNANATASATAHSAAAQAFLASRASAPNLSASAAAAALRSMSPPPTNVSQVQTKRTLQREMSISSNGSVQNRGRGPARPGIQRQGSSGSMTERTFRSPSPHGPGSKGATGPAPPVPHLPPDYGDIPPIPTKTHRRVASMEPPRRVQSPPLTKGGGRGQSLDRPAAPSSQRAAQKAAASRTSSLQKINELERTDSQNSINFSYPRNARPNSPPPRSPVTAQGEHRFPSTMRNGAHAASAGGTQYDVMRAAEQPVKKKKKKTAPGASEGSHFKSAGMGARPIATPLGSEPESQEFVDTPQPEPVKEGEKGVGSAGESSHFPNDSVSSQDGSESDSTPEKVPDRRAQRASGILNKQPSVVREDWEGEQEGSGGLASTFRQQADESLSPVGSLTTAASSKKASTAANVSKKIDEPTSSPKSNLSLHDSVTLGAPSTKQAENRKHLAVAGNDLQHTRTASLSPSRSFRFSDNLSSDLAAGQKHQPLPRSVSPAKSAMKQQSPSPTNGTFPNRLRTPSVTPSEASDNNSLISADGYVSATRKKKVARVSFDPEPEVVGVAAQQNQTETSPPASPRAQEAGKKGWFGFGKSKASALGTIAAEDDMEDVMTPRPALPFFGSVRNKPRGSESLGNTPIRQVQPATTSPNLTSVHNASTVSTTSSNSSNTSKVPTVNTSVSSDHAIGGLFSQAAMQGYTQLSAAMKGNNQPLPPEVTSVEGTGYASDTDSNPEVDDEKPRPPQSMVSHAQVSPIQPELAKIAPATHTDAIETVPTIEVHPATPGLEQSEPRAADQWQVQVPGGFPASTDQLVSQSASESRNEPILDVASTSPAGLGIAEPKPAETVSTATKTEPPLTALTQAHLDRHNGGEDERNSDADSIYSDAAESQAEFDGDGFGSINAIVESPMAPPPASRFETIAESPLSKDVTQSRPDRENRTASWDDTQAHWSGLAERYRQGVQQVPQGQQPQQQLSSTERYKQEVQQASQTQQVREQSSSIEPYGQAAHQAPLNQQAQDHPVLFNETKPKKKKARAPGAVAAAAAAVPASQKFMNSSSPPAASSRQKEAAAPQTGRDSDRNASEGFGRQSQKPQAGLDPALNLRNQPPPATAPPPKHRGALQKRQIPAAVVAASKSARPASYGGSRAPNLSPTREKPVQRTFSNDSDSESSFRKQRRRANSGGDQQYSMRRSMRTSQAAEPSRPTEFAGRGDIRSLSPVNRRPFSPVGGQKPMRSSMRGSVDSTGPTLRGEPAQQRSSSLFGRSKKPQSPVRSAPSKPLTNKVQSRFTADSDDEAEAAPRSYHSRFEESSDEEPEPVKYRPVRGIPRKTDEGESTDLEDSSDEEKRVPQSRKLPKINTQQTTIISNATEPPLSPTSEKKRGLFGLFRGKKDKDNNAKSKLGGGTIAERDAMLARNRPAVQTTRSPDKSHPSRLGFGSIAERDAMIERTRAQLEEARDQVPDSSTSSGKAQRRTPTRIMSDGSWPLPPKMLAANGDRPNTSDGVDMTASKPNARPGVNGRPNTTDSAYSAGGTPVYGRSGKKKRFSMLRRAFGLTD